MIIEPLPTTGRGARSGARQAATIVVPIALLAMVVGAALGGQSATPATDPSASQPVLVDAAAGASATPSADPAATPAPPPTPAVVPGEVPFPASWLGAPTITPTTALELHARGSALQPGPWLAVRGWFRGDPAPAACGDVASGPPSAWCPRAGTLADSPSMPTFGPGVAHGRHVHPYFPVGVRWPPVGSTTPNDGSATPGDDPSTPAPVVLLGRFGDPRAPACPPSTVDCEPAFTVEKVTWLDDRPVRWLTAVDPDLAVDVADPSFRERRNAARELLVSADAVTMVVYLEPANLGLLNADAATATTTAMTFGNVVAERVWYIRGVAVTPDPDGSLRGEVHWMVVDEATLTVLATNSLPAGIPLR